MVWLTRRGFRLAVLTLGLAGLFAALNAVPGAATPASGVTPTQFARGTDHDPGTIAIKQGMDIAIAKNVFTPGGSSGWHSHPGGAIAVVQSGAITLFRSSGSSCTSTTYTAGQSFIERPSDVQNGVNNGSVDAVVYVTFPSVPHLSPTRIDQPAPANCP
jgi:quercetin dioxygenase-like cupin family protein